MSSGSHQNYTRMWANELGIPIFSVDYRLAPKHQFPTALDDVWQVYYWLVTYAETQMGVKPDKILLAGDSAGGNLVAALTIQCIKSGFRVPDGLLMCYPALSLSKLRFTPSLLLSVDDALLPYPFLNMCLESYTGKHPDSDLISPAMASDEILSKFPCTRIMVPQNDALRDESL